MENFSFKNIYISLKGKKIFLWFFFFVSFLFLIFLLLLLFFILANAEKLFDMPMQDYNEFARIKDDYEGMQLVRTSISIYINISICILYTFIIQLAILLP